MASWRFLLVFFREFLSGAGFLWLVTETMAFFLPTKSEALSDYGWLFLGFAALWGLVRAVLKSRPLRRYQSRLPGRDISIGFEVGNIFASDGAVVVPTNCTFDTDLESRLVSASSVQGEFTRCVYHSEVQHLDLDIDRALEGKDFRQLDIDSKPGKLRCYDVGTVAHVRCKGRLFYLVAVTEINSSGRAAGRDEDLDLILARLWYDIGERGDKSHVLVPLIGTGHGRMTHTRDEVAKRIVRSFVAASAEKNFCERLTLAVFPGDVAASLVDVAELAQFIDFECRYSSVAVKKGAHGTPVLQW